MKPRTEENKGLSLHEVEQLRKQFGLNKLPDRPPESALFLFLRQFHNPINYLLLIAALLKLILEGPHDAGMISLILVVSAVIGAWQEGRATRVLSGLKNLLPAQCIVCRDGKEQIINNQDLVPGDLVILYEGSKIPADGTTERAERLCIDEAIITGESLAVEKGPGTALFMGTVVTSGSGSMVVTRIGAATMMGGLQRDVELLHTDFPLKRELTQLANYLLIASFFIVFCFFAVGVSQDKGWIEMLFAMTSLLVCIVPSGIPVVSSIALAFGAYRMAKANVVIKKLGAIDALGKLDVLIIDKTGTLTLNEQMVTKFFVDPLWYDVTGQGYEPTGTVIAEQNSDTHALSRVGVITALLDTTQRQKDPKSGRFMLKGEPIHAALGVLGEKLGYTRSRVLGEYEVLAEEPFDSVKKFQSITFKEKATGTIQTVYSGAPEAIFARCSSCSAGCHDASAHLLKEGLRTIALAVQADHVDGCSFVALIGLQDALRPESTELIEELRAAGIHVIMATGDHPETAWYVGSTVGLIGEKSQLVTGDDLRALSDDALGKRLGTIDTIARVTPREKLRLVQSFHRQGKIVGMTGDGVNDALALVAADVGISMGNIGTEVAQEASDVVLLDDSLASIVKGIEQGRHIILTMRRVILYLIITNAGEVLMMFMALLLGLPLPFVAVQILWINFITDGFLDIALGLEPQEPGLLDRKNFSRIKLVDRTVIYRFLTTGIPMALGSLYVYLKYVHTDLALARTSALVTLAMFQWSNAWNMRSETKSNFELPFFASKWLIGVTIFVACAQIAALYLPFMQSSLRMVPLSWCQLLESFLLASSVIAIEEVRKRISR